MTTSKTAILWELLYLANKDHIASSVANTFKQTAHQATIKIHFGGKKMDPSQQCETDLKESILISLSLHTLQSGPKTAASAGNWLAQVSGVIQPCSKHTQNYDP